MKMTKNEYQKYVEKKSPKSKTVKNMLKAFLSGGVICAIGQGFMNMYVYFGLKAEDAPVATSITLIFIGTALTGFKIYDKIAKFAGAGTLVPITGFANSVAAPALEYKSEGFLAGMSAKMFIIAGPVIVFGISVSIVYGIVYCLIK